MSIFNQLFERTARSVAVSSSRRSALARLGGMVVGGAMTSLLPVDRTANAQTPAGATGSDPRSCDYWKYCAIDGFLCECCGGSSSSCPPGTTPSPITWIGTCRNPADNTDYIISYNDCCGKGSCGRCFCNTNENETPLYKLSRDNDINWCMGTANVNYHCSVAAVIGVKKS
ncbi:methylamine dehydrogenase light chain [Paraburkholderia adhaesiva]|uniref:methylamine dehydrogenase light chain n=1 Tax=Paraburkholderia adhaesiva TaxID=2883244 RepID=UPI001F179DDB|nr:methylamine dehydrogenase light chain [Paraburkholderia adhaesiva]